MTIEKIKQMQTIINKGDMSLDCKGQHESTFRSYQILEKVKYYLSEKVPYKIILELIDEMEENTDDN